MKKFSLTHTVDDESLRRFFGNQNLKFRELMSADISRLPLYLAVYNRNPINSNFLYGCYGISVRDLEEMETISGSPVSLYNITEAILSAYTGRYYSIVFGMPGNVKDIPSYGMVVGPNVSRYSHFFRNGFAEINRLQESIYSILLEEVAFPAFEEEDLVCNLRFAYDEQSFLAQIKEGLYLDEAVTILYDPLGSTTWHKIGHMPVTVTCGVLIHIEGYYHTCRSRMRGYILNFNQMRGWDLARYLRIFGQKENVDIPQHINNVADIMYLGRVVRREFKPNYAEL